MATTTTLGARPEEHKRYQLSEEVHDSASLMEMIFQYLDEESPSSLSLSQQHFGTSSTPAIKQWREKLGDLENGTGETKLLKASSWAVEVSRSSRSSVDSSSVESHASDTGSRPSTRASSIGPDVEAEEKNILETRGTKLTLETNLSRSNNTKEPSTPMLATITDVTQLMPECFPEFSPTGTPVTINKGPLTRTTSRKIGTAEAELLSVLRVNRKHDHGLSLASPTRPAPMTPISPISPSKPRIHAPKLTVDTSFTSLRKRPASTYLRKRDPNIQTQPRNDEAKPAKVLPRVTFREPNFPTPRLPKIKAEDIVIEPSSPKVLVSRRNSVIETFQKVLRRNSATETPPVVEARLSVPIPPSNLLKELDKHTQQWRRISMIETPSQSWNDVEDQSSDAIQTRREPTEPLMLRKATPEIRRLEKVDEIIVGPDTGVIQKRVSTVPKWSHEFIAGSNGSQMRMSRRIVSFATGEMEWDIEGGEKGERVLRCAQNVNNLFQRKDFIDTQSRPLFTLQRSVGTTIIASTTTPTNVSSPTTNTSTTCVESHTPIKLFTIHSSPLPTQPCWTISFPATSPAAPKTKWLAKCDREMRVLRITCDGQAVGRISVEGRGWAKRHTYNVTVVEGREWCVVAALGMVFDDARVDGEFGR